LNFCYAMFAESSKASRRHDRRARRRALNLFANDRNNDVVDNSSIYDSLTDAEDIKNGEDTTSDEDATSAKDATSAEDATSAKDATCVLLMPAPEPTQTIVTHVWKSNTLLSNWKLYDLNTQKAISTIHSDGKKIRKVFNDKVCDMWFNVKSGQLHIEHSDYVSNIADHRINVISEMSHLLFVHHREINSLMSDINNKLIDACELPENNNSGSLDTPSMEDEIKSIDERWESEGRTTMLAMLVHKRAVKDLKETIYRDSHMPRATTKTEMVINMGIPTRVPFLDMFVSFPDKPDVARPVVTKTMSYVIDNMSTNRYLVVLDTSGNPMLAVILYYCGRHHIRIHYIGWDLQWDATISLESHRILWRIAATADTIVSADLISDKYPNHPYINFYSWRTAKAAAIEAQYAPNGIPQLSYQMSDPHVKYM
jgi:hypothetical protein